VWGFGQLSITQRTFPRPHRGPYLESPRKDGYRLVKPLGLVTSETMAKVEAILRILLGLVRLGLADVARTLSAQLEERRRNVAGNVVALDVRRRAGRG
jgi:hypothetical protein